MYSMSLPQNKSKMSSVVICMKVLTCRITQDI